VCNLYSQTKDRMTVMMRFKLKENRTAWFEPKASIFPGYEAPVVRVGPDGERELERMVWGFVRRPPGRAPSRVSNVRDDTILGNRFWTASFRERRALVPFSSYCEPIGKPASWIWHALASTAEARPLGAFPGIWKDYTGPVRKDGETVTQRVFSFLTTSPNSLPAAQEHGRMPVLLTREDEFEQWLHGSEEEAMRLARPFPAEDMRIVQEGQHRKDLLDAA
jgi:putative SOS response-associated peptidase YedK